MRVWPCLFYCFQVGRIGVDSVFQPVRVWRYIPRVETLGYLLITFVVYYIISRFYVDCGFVLYIYMICKWILRHVDAEPTFQVRMSYKPKKINMTWPISELIKSRKGINKLNILPFKPRSENDTTGTWVVPYYIPK